MANVDEIPNEVKVYGVNWQLDDIGDIVLATNGDAAVAVGYEALTQSVKNRVMTTKGEFVNDPTIGINWENYIGAAINNDNLISLQADIQDEIERDPLVRAAVVEVMWDDSYSSANTNMILIAIDVFPLGEANAVTIILDKALATN